MTDYDRIDAVNWSTLRAMRKSPLHYRHGLTAERTETLYMRIGLALHAFLLDPDEFERSFICYYGQRRGNAWKEFQAEHESKTILTESEWMRALGAASAISMHPVASQWLASGLSEKTLTWTDAETGLACKGRVDHVDAMLVEVKGTSVIEPRRFSSHAARMGYHGQIAFYQDGCVANDILVRDQPALITVELDPPHDVVPYRVPVHVVDVGRTLYRQLLGELKACRERGDWPGIAPDEVELILPDWIYEDEGPLELTMGGEAMEL